MQHQVGVCVNSAAEAMGTGKEVVLRLKPQCGWEDTQLCFTPCQTAFVSLIELHQ